MIDVPEDRRQRHLLFQRIDDAFKAGDFAALEAIFGDEPDWPDRQMPFELGLGRPLEYAIYWSPLAFIARLIDAGASPTCADDAGFPALIAALSTSRPDRLDIVKLLIERGSDLNQRGVNDWTPLHYAVNLRDAEAARLLLEAGADSSLRTRIDDYSTPLEDAERGGFAEGVALLAEGESRSTNR